MVLNLDKQNKGSLSTWVQEVNLNNKIFDQGRFSHFYVKLMYDDWSVTLFFQSYFSNLSTFSPPDRSA